MGRIKVEGHSNLVRDTRSGAIININKKEIERARRMKVERKEKEVTFENLKSDVSELKNDMSDIKQMLQKLVGKQ
jgi:hypothetical protein